ncbi:hypothetical protein C348_04246 [Cryptococcus neoformans Gb118]|nr:hypothetical protein C350_03999 [Cryptococcus neoformans var. grubii MW-RSA36]OXL07461.1 hypothetical protein C348_04246 [Cryptococcus neoformans var. grubii Gb118]
MSNFERLNKTGDAVLIHDDSEGPGVSAENPAGVHPDVGVNPAPRGSMPGSGAPNHHGDVRGIFGNPEVFKDIFGHLSSAFSEAISSIQHESGSGIGYVAKALIARLENMRDEVDGWRTGKGLPEVEKHGGELGEDVEQAEGDEGGLYKD